ncbi:hypothetical protein ACOHYD_13580 [Desulfobacterota bacterium M19]
MRSLFDRISSYESYVGDLCAIVAVIAYWCSESELNVLSKIVSRASDRLIEGHGGLTVWLNLRWYPLLLLLYHTGIAAVESKNYRSLAAILYTKLGGSDYDNSEPYFAHKLSNGILELTRANIFKRFPGHERHYAPDSEYLFKQVQPVLDDLLFLGKGYESAFDEFEVLYALAVADLRKQADGRTWGPIGRFGWKYNSQNNSPFAKLLNDASALKDNWPPIQAGMFGGSYERFELVVNEFKEILGRLNWY